MTNKQKQQLSINLDEISYCPHPEVDRAYKEANAEHLHFMEIPAYRNESRVYLCSKASGKPVKHKITGIYRRQVPGDKEYVFFHEAMVTKDYFGNIVEHTRLCGRYEKPNIQKSYGIPQGRRLVSNTDVTETMQAQELEVYVNDIQTVHEWEFEQIKPQLQEWYKNGIIDENTKLYAWIGTSKYGVNSFQDFISLSIDDLTLLCRAGTRFQGLLKGQELTPKILDAIREKLQTELITQINTDKK